MTQNRFAATSIAIAIAVLATAGCAAEISAVVPPTPSAPTVTPTPVERVEPVSAFQIACDDLVSDADIQAVVGDHGARRAALAPSAAYFGTRGASVLADGALSCEWPAEGTGHAIARLSVVALADAGSLYARVKPSLMERPAAYMPAYTSFDYFDDTLVECVDFYVDAMGYVCRWQVLVDDVWLAIELGGVPETDYHVPVPRENPDTSLKPIEPVVDGSASLELVTSIVDGIRSAPRVNVEHRSADLPTCSALIDVASLQHLATEPIATVLDENPPEFKEAPSPASLSDFSMERLGFRQCVVYAPRNWGVQFTVTTGLDWLLEPPFPVPTGTLQNVEGLGAVYTDCYSGEDGPGCSVTVVGADAMVSMSMYDSQDPEIPVAVARSVLAAPGA